MGDVVDLQGRQPARLSRSAFHDEVKRFVREGRVAVLLHLKRDHPERRISPRQIELCLERGTVQVDPYVNQKGNWQSEIYRHMAGQELTVVAAIEWEKQIIVITAY